MAGRSGGHAHWGAGTSGSAGAGGHDHGSYQRTGTVRLATRLKETSEIVQLDKLAFCLPHPALHRKLNFALRQKHVGWIGRSINVPVEERGDIYIDVADTTATKVWLDPAKVQAWVLARLTAQGIVLTTA